MRLQKVAIERINPAPYNPRKDLQPSDPEYQKIKRSIEEFGYVDPLIWNQRTGNLVAGHQRLKVLLALGRTKIAVVVVDLPIEKEKAVNIALNKISGEWDPHKLAVLLEEMVKLPRFDVEVTGFDLPDANALIAEMLHPVSDRDEHFDIDAALDRSRPAVTKPGELVVLGRHRLLCGDCTDRVQVRQLMRGKRAVLFATDPPYLVNYDGTNHPGKRGARDKNKDWSGSYGITWDDAAANPQLYDRFISAAVAEAIVPSAPWYCWHASRRQAMLEEVWTKHGAFVHQQIIWVKDRGILTRSWYSWQHEPCFFGWLKSRKPARRSKDYPSSVWHVPTVSPGQRTDHPTSKPLELFMIPMRQHTRAGELCYEPFCGSGSQLIAAEKLGRTCFAMEIDPHYCDVIVRRYIAFVGEAAVGSKPANRYRSAVATSGARR